VCLFTRLRPGSTAKACLHASAALLLTLLVLLAVSGWLANPLAAQTSEDPIDFETIPGATAQEGLTISDQFT